MSNDEIRMNDQMTNDEGRKMLQRNRFGLRASSFCRPRPSAPPGVGFRHSSFVIRHFYFLTLCSLILAPSLHAASVLLLNGESYTGKVQFINNQVVVAAQSGTVRIDLPQVLDAVFRDDRDQSKAGLFPAGVLLTDGSLIAGPVNMAADPIKIANLTIPMSSVAWVVFQPFARDKITEPASGETGAVLTNGQFFPGTIASVKDNTVAINSALFGPQRFSLQGRGDICALVLRDVQDAGMRYQVFTRTGSVYTVNDIRSENDNVAVTEPTYGNVRINKDDLSEIRVAKGWFEYLAGVKPDRVDAPAGIKAEDAVQVADNIDDPDGKNVRSAMNAAVTYTVPKGYATFSTGATVPQGAPATARFTFAVYGDGKFLLTRTPLIAPGDAAQHISVLVSNLHTITLRVEPGTVGATGFGQWVQPMFLRP